MERITITVDDATLQYIDAVAVEYCTSRSGAIRIIVQRGGADDGKSDEKP